MTRRGVAQYVPRADSAGGVDALVERGQADDAKHALTLVFQADQRGIERHAVNERLCPVDRIQNPAESVRAGLIGQFLAKQSVVRKGVGDAAAQQLLGPPVGAGNGCVVAFEFNIEVVAAKVVKGEASGLAGRLDGQSQPRFNFAGEMSHG